MTNRINKILLAPSTCENETFWLESSLPTRIVPIRIIPLLYPISNFQVDKEVDGEKNTLLSNLSGFHFEITRM